MIKVHTTVKHVTPYCNPNVEDLQRFGRFVFFCVRVLIVGVLSLSSPSSKKSSSRKKSCCVSVPRVLQQVVHCKTHLLKGGTATHKCWCVKVIIPINCTELKRPHIFPPLLLHFKSLTAFFAEDEQKLCSCLLHAHVHMCHEANQLVSDGGANLWPALHIFQWGKYLKKRYKA